MGSRARAIGSWATRAVVVFGLVACTDSGDQPRTTGQPADSAAASSADLLQPRAVHRATRLLDGRVLLTGGCTEPGCGGFDQARTSEIYDPRTGRFSAGPSMSVGRAAGTATLLADGRVVLIGGYPGEGQLPDTGIEVFDPASDTFESFGDLTTARADHTATLLADGRVLIAGGFGADGQPLGTTELLDPSTGTVEPGPRLSAPRAAHVAVSASDSVVLLGGTQTGSGLRTTDLWDGQRWAPGPMLLTPRVKHAAVTLDDGRILVVGGALTTEGRRRLATTELLSLDTSRAVAGPTLTERQYKLDGAVVLLPRNRVAVAGGRRVEVVQPDNGRVFVVEQRAHAALSFVTATLVSPRSLLVAGGYDESIVPTSAARLVRLPS